MCVNEAAKPIDISLGSVELRDKYIKKLDEYLLLDPGQVTCVVNTNVLSSVSQTLHIHSNLRTENRQLIEPIVFESVN